MAGPTREPESTPDAGPSGRWARFGAFPATGAVIALFGVNLLVAGTLHAREGVAAGLQLILLGVFVAYCFARPHGGALLAAPVVGGGLLVGVLSAVSPLLGLVAAVVVFATSFVVANRLDEQDDQLRRRSVAREPAA